MKLVEKYKDPVCMLAAMTPMRLTQRCEHLTTLSQFVALNAPTLKDIEIAAGGNSEAPKHFIAMYLQYLNGMLNIKADMKMTEFQIDDCALTLYRECRLYTVTIAEFHEFMTRVKSGRYGEFYGAIDVMRICSDFQQFVVDLLEARKYVARTPATELRKQREIANQLLINEKSR